MDNKNKNLVYLAAIVFALIIGFSFLFTKIALKSADPIDILAYRFTASFIAILIPVIFKWIKLDYSKERIIKIIPLALFYPLILSKIEASKMSVFSNLGTVISIIAGVIFLKEEIYYYHILGSILIIIGVIGANKSK